MSALNTNNFAYVIPPTAQFKDEDGVPYSAGFVEFYKHGTSEKYITYADWAGSYNPFRIQLNSQGRCVAIIPKGVLLDMYVYNFIGNLAYSRLNIGADGASGDTTTLQFTSHDGSIIIDRDGNVVDLTVKHDDNTYGNITGTTTDNNGAIIFSNVVDGDIELSGGKLIVEAHKLYHITLAMEFATSTLGVNYASCVVRDSDGGAHDFVLDESIAENFAEVSWDTVATSTRLQLALQVPAKFSLNMAHLFIHTVNPVVTGESGGGGSTADIEVTSDDDSVTVNESMVGDTKVFDLRVRAVPSATSEDEGKILSVDDDGNPEWIEPQTFSQEQANWTESDTSDPSYIQNKPDLDQYAKTADLAPVALSNDYTDLNNRPSIPVVNDGTLTIQKNGTTIDTFSANSSANKTINVTVPTKISDITNDSGFITANDIPAQVQSNWSESDTNDPSYIQNKPSIPSATSDLQNDSGFITASDVPGAQEQSDWSESSSSDPAYIKNKPTIRNVPDVTSSDDSKVLKATYSGGVGSYSWQTESGGSVLPPSTSTDEGKVLTVDSQGDAVWDNPAAQEQSDWTETNTADPAYIKNKPDKTSLIAGSNITIVENLQNSTITISATSSLTYINVTPSSGTIALDATTHQSAFLMSSAEVTAITNQDGNMNSVVIQWTSTSSTTLPTVPSTWHAASANPTALTVGNTYQLSLLGTCYSIVEFA